MHISKTFYFTEADGKEHRLIFQDAVPSGPEPAEPTADEEAGGVEAVEAAEAEPTEEEATTEASADDAEVGAAGEEREERVEDDTGPLRDDEDDVEEAADQVGVLIEGVEENVDSTDNDLEKRRKTHSENLERRATERDRIRTVELEPREETLGTKQKTLAEKIQQIKQEDPACENDKVLKDKLQADTGAAGQLYKEVVKLQREIKEWKQKIDRLYDEDISEERSLDLPPKTAAEAHMRDMQYALEDAVRAKDVPTQIACALRAFVSFMMLIRGDSHEDVDQGKEAVAKRNRRKELRTEIESTDLGNNSTKIDALIKEKEGKLDEARNFDSGLKDLKASHQEAEKKLQNAQNALQEAESAETPPAADDPNLVKLKKAVEDAQVEVDDALKDIAAKEKEKPQAGGVEGLAKDVQELKEWKGEVEHRRRRLESSLGRIVEMSEGKMNFLKGVQIGLDENGLQPRFEIKNQEALGEALNKFIKDGTITDYPGFLRALHQLAKGAEVSMTGRRIEEVDPQTAVFEKQYRDQVGIDGAGKTKLADAGAEIEGRINDLVSDEPEGQKTMVMGNIGTGLNFIALITEGEETIPMHNESVTVTVTVLGREMTLRAPVQWKGEAIDPETPTLDLNNEQRLAAIENAQTYLLQRVENIKKSVEGADSAIFRQIQFLDTDEACPGYIKELREATGQEEAEKYNEAKKDLLDRLKVLSSQDDNGVTVEGINTWLLKEKVGFKVEDEIEDLIPLSPTDERENVNVKAAQLLDLEQEYEDLMFSIQNSLRGAEDNLEMTREKFILFRAGVGAETDYVNGLTSLSNKLHEYWSRRPAPTNDTEIQVARGFLAGMTETVMARRETMREDYDVANAQLERTDQALAVAEVTLQAADELVGQFSEAVPYGELVYTLSKNITRVIVDPSQMDDAVVDVVIDLALPRLGSRMGIDKIKKLSKYPAVKRKVAEIMGGLAVGAGETVGKDAIKTVITNLAQYLRSDDVNKFITEVTGVA